MKDISRSLKKIWLLSKQWFLSHKYIPLGRINQTAPRTFLVPTRSLPVLGFKQSPTSMILWGALFRVKWAGRETGNSHYSSVEVKNTWMYATSPSCSMSSLRGAQLRAERYLFHWFLANKNANLSKFESFMYNYIIQMT